MGLFSSKTPERDDAAAKEFLRQQRESLKRHKRELARVQGIISRRTANPDPAWDAAVTRDVRVDIATVEANIRNLERRR